MSQMNIIIVNDSISPKLKKLLREAGSNSKIVLRSMGNSLKSWTVQSFIDPSKRIEAWAPLKDGTPTTLQNRHGAARLRPSITMRTLTEKEARIATEADYSSYHQFGTRRGLPRRPFFPFTKEGKMSDAAEASVYAAGRKAFDSSLKK